MAICTLHLHGEEKKEEIPKLFAEVPKLRQKIAGKSIPLEVSPLLLMVIPVLIKTMPQKFVARRAEKFQEQDGRLCLAALELAYVFGGIAHAPRSVIAEEMLPQARAELVNLEACKNKPETWGNGQGYWDDYCLCRFLEAVCERYLEYPVCGGALPSGMFLNLCCRTQTLYWKMMMMFNLGLVPGYVQRPLSMQSC